MLGVRPAWRTKGLGLALLHQSFGEFYKRGTKTIGLAVDAFNATGATRLCQKADMSTVSEFVTIEKELRAGKTSGSRKKTEKINVASQVPVPRMFSNHLPQKYRLDAAHGNEIQLT